MKEMQGQVPNRNGLRYSAGDKLKAVKQLYLGEGYQLKAIAQELGIGKSSLGKWIREYRKKVLLCSCQNWGKVLWKWNNPIRPGNLSKRKFSNIKQPSGSRRQHEVRSVL